MMMTSRNRVHIITSAPNSLFDNSVAIHSETDPIFDDGNRNDVRANASETEPESSIDSTDTYVVCRTARELKSKNSSSCRYSKEKESAKPVCHSDDNLDRVDINHLIPVLSVEGKKMIPSIWPPKSSSGNKTGRVNYFSNMVPSITLENKNLRTLTAVISKAPPPSSSSSVPLFRNKNVVQNSNVYNKAKSRTITNKSILVEQKNRYKKKNDTGSSIGAYTFSKNTSAKDSKPTLIKKFNHSLTKITTPTKLELDPLVAVRVPSFQLISSSSSQEVVRKKRFEESQESEFNFDLDPFWRRTLLDENKCNQSEVVGDHKNNNYYYNDVLFDHDFLPDMLSLNPNQETLRIMKDAERFLTEYRKPGPGSFVDRLPKFAAFYDQLKEIPDCECISGATVSKPPSSSSSSDSKIKSQNSTDRSRKSFNSLSRQFFFLSCCYSKRKKKKRR